MRIYPETEPSGGLIAPHILTYLESQHKRIDDAVLSDTVRRMRTLVVKDLMSPRESRAGREHNTLYTGACARKSRLIYDGAQKNEERPQARKLLKFLLGDLIEETLLCLSHLSGAKIEDNNADLTVTGRDGVLIPVHPDGRFTAETGWHYNVEIKSCDTHTFDAWLANGGPDDTWGYRTQASMEVQAWREAGYDVQSTIFLAISTGSRQGSIAEWLLPYEPELVEAWHQRREQARGTIVPPILFASEPELAFKRGKTLSPEDALYGQPMPRKNEAGAIYGHDIHTGRQIVPLQCSYCDFLKTQCWQSAEMDIDGKKPIWVVPHANG